MEKSIMVILVALLISVAVLSFAYTDTKQALKEQRERIDEMEYEYEKTTWQTFTYLYPLLIDKKQECQTIQIGKNYVLLSNGKINYFVIDGDISASNYNRKVVEREDQERSDNLFKSDEDEQIYKNRCDIWHKPNGDVYLEQEEPVNRARNWCGVEYLGGNFYKMEAGVYEWDGNTKTFERIDKRAFK